MIVYTNQLKRSNPSPDRPVTDKPVRFRFERLHADYKGFYRVEGTGRDEGYMRLVAATNIPSALEQMRAEFPNARKA